MIVVFLDKQESNSVLSDNPRLVSMVKSTQIARLDGKKDLGKRR